MSDSDTSGALTSDTNFAAKDGEGMVILDEGASAEELAYATGKTGATLTIPLANRGLEGGSAQAHSSGATVKGIISAAMWNDLIDSACNVLVKTTGIVDVTKVVGITSGNINSALTGWIAATDTWTYASATTFTIAGVDRTAMFPKGTKLKLTQTSAKYFYVVGSAFSTNTTITVTGGTDYTVANATITLPYYSYVDTPQGYPQWFAFTPTWAASGGSPAIGGGTLTGKFCVNGRLVTARYTMIIAGDSTKAGTEWTWTLPIAAVAAYVDVGPAYLYDAGTKVYVGVAQTISTTAMSVFPEATTGAVGASTSVPFTWTTNDAMRATISYEI